jgi:preprotein translocase subunit YajC
MLSSRTLLVTICLGLALSAGATLAQTAPAAPAVGEELKSAINKAPAPAAGQSATAPADQQPAPGNQPQRKPSLLEGQGLIFVMLAFLVVMMLWSSRRRKKQETKQKEMLASLKKGDKVTSIGGIVGTIIEARDDEVVVKVDETNNVRMRFARWAIKGTGESAKTQPPEEKK